MNIDLIMMSIITLSIVTMVLVLMFKDTCLLSGRDYKDFTDEQLKRFEDACCGNNPPKDNK